MTAAEVAVALRTALPLVVLPEHGGKTFEIDVAKEWVWGRIEADGDVVCLDPPASNVDARGGGRVKAWLDAIVTGTSHGIHAESADPLIETLLSRLHAALWTNVDPDEQPVAAIAPGG
jgi:hypothetical protein